MAPAIIVLISTVSHTYLINAVGCVPTFCFWDLWFKKYHIREEDLSSKIKTFSGYLGSVFAFEDF